MLLTYIDVIIVVAIIQFLGILALIFWKYIEIKFIKKDIDKLNTAVTKTIKRVSLLEVSGNKILGIMNLNVDDISCSKAQIEQLQRYITQVQPYMEGVVQISNLVGCVERNISPAELIEKVKADIEWAREVEKLKSQDEYYEAE